MGTLALIRYAPEVTARAKQKVLRLYGNLRAGEQALLLFQIVLVGAILIHGIVSGRFLWQPFFVQTFFLVGYALTTEFCGRSDYPLSPFVRVAATWFIILQIYNSTSFLSFALNPFSADAGLYRIDQFLCGQTPGEWLAVVANVFWLNELLGFSYIYLVIFAYIWLGVASMRWPEPHRHRVYDALGITYAFGFLGYLLFPAKGPIATLHTQLPELIGSFFTWQASAVVDSHGGPHGALPSMHAAASVLLLLGTASYRPKRLLYLIPMVIVILWSTMQLRFHYVVDLLVGSLLAIGCYASTGYVRYRQRLSILR